MLARNERLLLGNCVVGDRPQWAVLVGLVPWARIFADVAVLHPSETSGLFEVDWPVVEAGQLQLDQK